jgi:hypothetical protein
MSPSELHGVIIQTNIILKNLSFVKQGPIIRSSTSLSSVQNLSIYLSMTLQPLWTLAAFFSFLIHIESVGFLVRGSARRKAAIYTQNIMTQNNCRQTSVPRVRFEPTIRAFERAKKVHALDRAATVIGSLSCNNLNNYLVENWTGLQRKYLSIGITDAGIVILRSVISYLWQLYFLRKVESPLPTSKATPELLNAAVTSDSVQLICMPNCIGHSLRNGFQIGLINIAFQDTCNLSNAFHFCCKVMSGRGEGLDISFKKQKKKYSGTSGVAPYRFFIIWFGRLLALRPLLAYCASLGW